NIPFFEDDGDEKTCLGRGDVFRTRPGFATAGHRTYARAATGIAARGRTPAGRRARPNHPSQLEPTAAPTIRLESQSRPRTGSREGPENVHPRSFHPFAGAPALQRAAACPARRRRSQPSRSSPRLDGKWPAAKPLSLASLAG